MQRFEIIVHVCSRPEAKQMFMYLERLLSNPPIFQLGWMYTQGIDDVFLSVSRDIYDCPRL